MLTDRFKSLPFKNVKLDLTRPNELVVSGSLHTADDNRGFATAVEGLHDYVVAQALTSFTVDVRGLSFVNSSALRPFMAWVSRAKQHGYRIVFLTDQRITWHRLSFSVLKSLAPFVVQVHEAAPSALGAESW